MAYTEEQMERMKRNLGIVKKKTRKKRTKRVKDPNYRDDLDYVVELCSNITHEGESGYTKTFGKDQNIYNQTFEDLHALMLVSFDDTSEIESKIADMLTEYHNGRYGREFFIQTKDAIRGVAYTDKVGPHLKVIPVLSESSESRYYIKLKIEYFVL
jgi:hypothetical protein